MYKVGERVITELGVGDILQVKSERYYVFIEFPYDNSGSYETWVDDCDIRYSITDYGSKITEDEYVPQRRIKEPKPKKQKIKYSYGAYTTVWR